MHLTLTLLAGMTMPGTVANLDLASGKLTHWQADGGKLVSLGGTHAVSTVDDGTVRKAIVYRTFLVPAGAVAIEFAAAVYRPDGVGAGAMLDVVLEAARREILPMEVRQGNSWVAASHVFAPDGRKLRDYRWLVGGHAGKRVRLAIVDSDERPGCHVVRTGFRLVLRDEINGRQFADEMRKLHEKHHFDKPLRFDSKHFMALSTADTSYSEYRLYNCETIYTLFFSHFRKRGFEARVPAEKLMVAIFDTPDGLEAYLGQKLSSSVTGLYHPASNRLVIYNYANNPSFVSGASRAAAQAKRGSTDLERERKIVAFGRAVRDRRDDVNISTVMHEVAHQLSFNCGMLNRSGDVPVWLAEGLAVYCESTVNGAWQGIGEANPSRAGGLVAGAKGKAPFIPLRNLVENDNWIRKAKRVDQVLLGYSQSWALFRLLIEERPGQLKAYMQAIHDRRTPDHRLTDFGAAFGSDMGKLEKRYQAYMREIVHNEVR